MRVLLVDDEIELVSAMSERLNIRGVDAEYVVSGKEALEKARECRYDVLVVDLKMPGMSGLEVVQAVKKIHPDTGFICLTGYGCNDENKESKAVGADFYLMKPVKISILLEKLEQACKSSSEACGESK